VGIFEGHVYPNNPQTIAELKVAIAAKYQGNPLRVVRVND